MRKFESLTDLRQALGVALPPGRWHRLTPEAARSFAELTGDRQWIHTPTLCGGLTAHSPAGTPEPAIAQAALLLGLSVGLLAEAYSFPWARRTLQRGYDGIRFPASAPLDSHVRLHATPAELTDVGTGSSMLVTRISLECDRADRPVLRGSMIALLEGTESDGPVAPEREARD